MRIINQLALIFGICFGAILLEKIIPLPSSIISLLLLLIMLICGVIKQENIKDVSKFLLANMAFLFVPALVSVMNYYHILKSSIAPILFICFITTILTMLVTYYATSLAKKVIK